MVEPVKLGQTEQGALTGLSLLDEEEDNKPITYGVFQNVSMTPDIDYSDLQNVYGLDAMPIFQWVRTIQTGERSFDPGQDSEDLKKQTQEKIKQYEEILEKTGGTPPPGMMTPEELEKALIVGTTSQVAQAVGSKIGSTLVDPYIESGDSFLNLDKISVSNLLKESPQSLVTDATSAGFDMSLDVGEIFQPELANVEVARATGNLDTFNALKGARTSTSSAANAAYDQNELSKLGYSFDGGKIVAPSDISANITASAVTQATEAPGYFENVGKRLYGTPEAAQNWSSAATGAVANFGVQILMGASPKQAAKSAAGSAVGKALGTAFLTPVLGPFAGVVGGAIGSLIGGRVICNELMRQGVMTRKQVILDYRFTRDYLTPQHVNGYHCWAVWMVKQMRKGKFVKFWKHVAGHRANEIAYIYGERDKPDYLGKVYRRILEPTCWLVGAFKKESDWSILYKQKEI